MSKKKKTVNVRNPIAPALRDPMFRKKIAKSGEERQEQLDPWSKKAKHKNGNLEEAAPTTLAEFYNTPTDAFQIGDKVDVVKGPLKKVLDRAEAITAKKQKEQGTTPDTKKKDKDDHAIVRNAYGPAGTIGITVDGEYHLVDEEDVKLICEAFDADFEDLKEWSYAEMTSGINVPVSSEEREIINKCSGHFYKSDLDDREQEVARRLVSRGVIHRRKDDKGIYFVRDNQKVSRF